MTVSFVIPFHNEAKNAGPMLEQILAYTRSRKWQFEVIPVNDRSSDETQVVLDSYSKKHSQVRPLEREQDSEELGNTMGMALTEGTRCASGDIIIWTMGDCSDDPETYGKIVEKIEDGFDMVFGSRYMPGGSRGNLDPAKAFLSSQGTLIARLIFGIPVHDITNAFRGFRKEVFNKVWLESPNFAISPEFAVKAHLAGFKLGEVPTVYTNRTAGVSSFKVARMSMTYLGVYLKCFLRLTRINAS